LACAGVAWAGIAGIAETAGKKGEAKSQGGGAAAAAKSGTDAKASGAEAKKGPRIAVEPPEFNFGKALQNKTLTKEFSVKNFGSEDLVITNVATSCGCTVAQLSTRTLKPGASTALIVNMETRAGNGPIEKTVTIESNDPAKLFEVKLKAEVSPEKQPEAPKAQ
jgi:hypothetical protein